MMSEGRLKSWMPMYWGDYFGDTQHLTTEEHGAYLLLIARYWQTGESLPDDDAALAKLCKLSAYKWRKVSPTVRQFFHADGGRLFHQRIEREMEKVAEKSRKARASIAKRWENRDTNVNQDEQKTYYERNTPTTTTTDSSLRSESDSANDLFGGEAKPNGKQPPAKRQAMPVAMAAEFDAWWAEYPKKVGKGDARKAYLKARKVVGPGELLDGLRRAARYWRDQGTEARFIPNPATWLNGERWNDDCAAAGQSRNLNPYQI